jgi:plastocyanin
MSVPKAPAAHVRTLVAIAVAAAWLAGVGASAASEVHTVTIDGFEFRPAVVTVKAGDVVVWRNSDPVPHTVTAQGAGLASSNIAPGGTFRFTARRAGRVDYLCSLHPTMKGALVVE